MQAKTIEGSNDAQKEANEWSQVALQLTEELLSINPEHYTVWNYRRDIFTNLVFAER